MNPPRVLFICTLYLLAIKISAISSVQLTTDTGMTVMYNNNQYSGEFLSSHNSLTCSNNNLFTYKQTAHSLQFNAPYQISIQGVTSPLIVSISTYYGIISPTIIPNSCTSDCTLQIRNYCPNPVGYFSYFDIVIINISGLSISFEYNVLCNKDFGTDTFQGGQFIIIIAANMIIVLSAIYSRAWSFKSKGIEIKYWHIAVYTTALAIGGTILILAPNVAQVIGDVIIWFIGISGIIVCFDEILFKLRIQPLYKTLLNIKSYGIRIMDILSFAIGLTLLLTWILADKNWIVSDIISVCVIISTIKIFKITSFKKALLLYLISISIEIVFVILIDVLEKTSYQNFLLNDFNNPLEIQLPTINPVLGSKCSWLPVSVTIFPGILISYFKRFDNSRNTKIYLIASSVAFLFGSLLWVVFSVVSPIQLPFQLISEPAMLGLVFVFAYNRKQMKILWNGKFYDPQFMNQEQEQDEQYTYQMQVKKVELKQSFFDALKIGKHQINEYEENERQNQKEHENESKQKQKLQQTKMQQNKEQNIKQSQIKQQINEQNAPPDQSQQIKT